MKTIADEWKSFSTVISPQAPPAQHREMQKAFYAGVAAMFGLLVTQVSDGDEVQEVDLQMMDGFKQELEDYTKELLRNMI